MKHRMKKVKFPYPAVAELQAATELLDDATKKMEESRAHLNEALESRCEIAKALNYKDNKCPPDPV